MDFTKSPPELIALFDRVVPGAPVERRQMFGYPCAFVGGHLCLGLFRSDFFVRLPEVRRAQLCSTDGAKPFEPMPGRPMREYVVLTPSLLAHPDALRGLVAESLAFARSLPPKAKKRPLSERSAGKKPIEKKIKPTIKTIKKTEKIKKIKTNKRMNYKALKPTR